MSKEYNQNTTSYKVLNDDIEINIGDTKAQNFEPHIDFKRHNGLSNFSVKFVDLDETSATEVDEEDKIKYKKDDYEVHFYEKQEAFEIEIKLLVKPKTNIFEFDIDLKGLDAFYQSEIADDHPTVLKIAELKKVSIDEAKRIMRPENAVGSYAIYTDKTGNFTGVQYKAGKVCHIYRPKVVDDNGDEIWGELNIEDGKLRITVDQTWLDNAKYPVLVDPTFGYTSVGESLQYVPGSPSGSVFAGSAGDGESISVYLQNLDGSPYDVLAALYKHSDSTIETDGLCDATELGASETAWIALPFDSEPTLTAIDYVPIVALEYAEQLVFMFWDEGDTDQGHSYGDFGFPFEFDDPASFVHDDKKYSLYVTYEASGSDLFKALSDVVRIIHPPKTPKAVTKAFADPLSVLEASFPWSRKIWTSERQLSDSMGMVEEETKVIGKGEQEAMAITEEEAKRITRERIELFSMMEARLGKGRDMGIGRSSQDYEAIVESIVNGISKSLSDSGSIIDEIVNKVSVSKADAVIIYDVLIAILTATHSADDVQRISDKIMAKLVSVNREESVAIAEQVFKIFKSFRELNESEGIADQLALITSIPKQDAVAVYDILLAKLGRELLDELGISEALDFNAGVAKLESEQIIDSVVKSITTALIDSESIADAIANKLSIPRSDAVAIADGLTTVLGRQLADTISIGDINKLVVTANRADVLSMVEVISRNIGKALDDSSAITEQLSIVAGITKEDAVGIYDSILLVRGRALSDQINASAIIKLTVSGAKQEAEAISELATKDIGVNRLDPVAISDLMDAVLNPDALRNLSDNEPIVEQIAKILSISKSDAMTVADSISNMLGKQFADQLGVSDATTFKPGKRPQDTESITDGLIKSIVQGIVDNQTISDVVAKVFSFNIQDTQTISDALEALRTFNRAFSDTVVIADQFAFDLSEFLQTAIGDTMEVGDSAVYALVAVNKRHIARLSRRGVYTLKAKDNNMLKRRL